MKNKITVILFLVIFECNGHGILGDILSTAQKRAESVAGAVLGGLNILGNRQNHQDVPQKGPEETIIIVVEEPKSDYGNQGPMHHHPPPRHPPPHHHHHHHHKPPFNNDSPPPPPPPHHGRPPFDNDSPPGPPHHHHERPPPPPPPHHHPHPPPYGNPRPGDNFYNEGPSHHNEYGNHHNPSYDQDSNGSNGNDRPYNNNNGNSHNNGYQPNSKGTEGNQENNYFEKPTTEHIKTPNPTKYPQWPKQDETDKTTKRPSDKPLYVPLNPNEYIYGGDKINITAPKRDTDQTKIEESGDDDFDIDIRLKNE